MKDHTCEIHPQTEKLELPRTAQLIGLIPSRLRESGFSSSFQREGTRAHSKTAKQSHFLRWSVQTRGQTKETKDEA